MPPARRAREAPNTEEQRRVRAHLEAAVTDLPALGDDADEGDPRLHAELAARDPNDVDGALPVPEPADRGKGAAGRGGAGRAKGKGQGKGAAAAGRAAARGGKGFKGGGKGRGGGGRGRGRGAWQAAALRVRMRITYKKAGKGTRRTLGYAITGAIEEGKALRTTVDSTFEGAIACRVQATPATPKPARAECEKTGDAMYLAHKHGCPLIFSTVACSPYCSAGTLAMDYDRSEREHVVTSSAREQWDLTHQMAHEIHENIKTCTVNGVLACPTTAQFLEQSHFDAHAETLTLDDLPALRPPRVRSQHSNCFEDEDGNYIDDYRFVWGDTYFAREWFRVRRSPIEPHAHDSAPFVRGLAPRSRALACARVSSVSQADPAECAMPGGGTAVYHVATLDPITQTPIKMAWAFDASRTFDLSATGGSEAASLAAYLTHKFGFEVEELDDLFWNDAAGADDDDGVYD